MLSVETSRLPPLNTRSVETKILGEDKLLNLKSMTFNICYGQGTLRDLFQTQDITFYILVRDDKS